MRKTNTSQRGYTFVELMIAASVVIVAGGLFFSVARGISYLAAKNAAVNLTHMQAREAIHRAVTEIRDAVSVPQLTDSALTSLGGSSGPAAGVSYQQLVSGPCIVYASAAAGQKQVKITVRAGDPAIASGMRLLIPAFFIEDDITAVTAASGTPATRTVTLSKNIPTAITCTAGVPNYVAYFTQRSALVVNGTDLRYYENKVTGGFTVVANNITSPQPFGLSADNKFVQSSFTTQDPRILQRGFKSMNLQLSLAIPYRCRLATYQ